MPEKTRALGGKQPSDSISDSVAHVSRRGHVHGCQDRAHLRAAFRGLIPDRQVHLLPPPRTCAQNHEGAPELTPTPGRGPGFTPCQGNGQGPWIHPTPGGRSGPPGFIPPQGDGQGPPDSPPPQGDGQGPWIHPTPGGQSGPPWIHRRPRIWLGLPGFTPTPRGWSGPPGSPHPRGMVKARPGFTPALGGSRRPHTSLSGTAREHHGWFLLPL